MRFDKGPVFDSAVEGAVLTSFIMVLPWAAVNAGSVAFDNEIRSARMLKENPREGR